MNNFHRFSVSSSASTNQRLVLFHVNQSEVSIYLAMSCDFMSGELSFVETFEAAFTAFEFFQFLLLKQKVQILSKYYSPFQVPQYLLFFSLNMICSVSSILIFKSIVCLFSLSTIGQADHFIWIILKHLLVLVLQQCFCNSFWFLKILIFEQILIFYHHLCSLPHLQLVVEDCCHQSFSLKFKITTLTENLPTLQMDESLSSWRLMMIRYKAAWWWSCVWLMRGGRWGRLTAVPPPDTGVNTTHYYSHVDGRRGMETLNETFPI